MELVQAKSLLAKLMATENIIVEQKKVETASFDVKNRILTLPLLDKNISGYLYDLLVSHEVGHALYTPQDGITKAVDLGLNMSIMNVLEDSRIERKIKNKYPGVRISFVRGYKELIDKDFFGTKDVDLNELNFIDRVNLYTKGGPTQGIQFNSEETALLNAIESTVTYDDVIEVAKKLTSYLEQEREKKKFMLESSEEDDADDIEGLGYEDSEEMSQDDTDGSQPEESEALEDKRLSDKNQDSNSSAGAKEGKETEAKTDRTFQENQKKLYETSGGSYYYADIPDVDINKMIVPYKEIWNKYKKTCEAYNYMNDDAEYNKVRSDSTKVVSYLAKEFELRKNADQMKRASIAKTGELNLSKIYSYKFNEDLFKKATVVPNGKSHGIVMFLDWSGSMSDNLDNTIKQLINLTLFCRKVLIPFEVYAFSSEYGQNEWMVETKKIGNMVLHKCNLLNILSSKMSAAEFKFACSSLLHCASLYRRPDFLALGGTPLNEAIIAAMKIIPEFKKQYKLQIVNTIFLTDGEAHPTPMTYQEYESFGKSTVAEKRSFGTMVIRHKKTMLQEVVDSHSQTSALLKLCKQITGCNIVGFYILNGRDFKNVLYRYKVPVDYDLARAEFRKNNYRILTSAGYDEYYLIRAEGMDTDDDEGFVVKENATTRGLVSAFSKYTSGRLMNRVVLNRFIGVIS